MVGTEFVHPGASSCVWALYCERPVSSPAPIGQNPVAAIANVLPAMPAGRLGRSFAEGFSLRSRLPQISGWRCRFAGREFVPAEGSTEGEG
jgi:hypothetical protein